LRFSAWVPLIQFPLLQILVELFVSPNLLWISYMCDITSLFFGTFPSHKMCSNIYLLNEQMDNYIQGKKKESTLLER
jgi:hypothetical protein